MTEKRIREIAVKMVKAFNGGTVPFGVLSIATQAAWISAARIAVNEVQGMEATKLLKSATKMVRGWHGKLAKSTAKSCRIGPGGKRACK